MSRVEKHLAKIRDAPIFLQVRNLGKGLIVEIARITSKGQITIPKKVRDSAHLAEGDLVAFFVEGNHVQFRKLAPGGDDYLRSVQATLSEWNSPEDEEAWGAL